MVSISGTLCGWCARKQAGVAILLAAMVCVAGCDKVQEMVGGSKAKKVKTAPMPTPAPEPVRVPSPPKEPVVETPPEPAPTPEVPLAELKTDNPRAQLLLKRALDLLATMKKSHEEYLALAEKVDAASWRKAVALHDDWHTSHLLLNYCVRVLRKSDEPAGERLSQHLRDDDASPAREADKRVQEAIPEALLRKRLNRRSRKRNTQLLARAQGKVNKALADHVGLGALDVFADFRRTRVSGLPMTPYWWKLSGDAHINSLIRVHMDVQKRFGKEWPHQMAAAIEKTDPRPASEKKRPAREGAGF